MKAPVSRFLPAWTRRLMRRGLQQFGYALYRLRPSEGRHDGPSFDTRRPLPPGARERLRPDHPRLRELRERYRGLATPLAQPSIWTDAYLSRELSLEYFRGDNAYVWQFRNTLGDERRKYYLFARYVEGLDARGLLRTLREDGAFGCWTFEFESLPTISRDLLDSINELYFLHRHCGLLDRPGLRVLDIGAGYGRLAHRMTAAADVARYYCADAVPESTFLCEFYLEHRGCQDRAVAVPLDQLEANLAGAAIDLAVNIHSFSEMPFAAIEAWLRLVARREVPRLLIVPNPAEGLVSYESDGTRREFQSLLADLGYHLTVREPIILDADVRSLVGIQDHFYLLARR